MSEKRHHAGSIGRTVVMLTLLAATPSIAQTNVQSEERQVATSAEDYQRYEAERLRQQQSSYESERQRQENERREQEQMRAEIERREHEQLRLEAEALERERTQQAQQQASQVSVGNISQSAASDGTAIPDIYEQLRIIGQLRDDGILTEEEFNGLKKKILN